MILNFSNLTKDQQIKLSSIYHDNKNNLEKIFYNLIKKDEKNFLVFSCLTSRNPEENNLYYKFAAIKLIEYYYKKKKLKKIITQDKFLTKLIKKKFKNLRVINNHANRFSFKNNLSIFKNLFFFTKLYLFKNKKRKNFFLEKKKIILIDIFLIESMFYGSKFDNRYYSSYFNNFQTKDKNRIFYLPIFFNRSLTRKNMKIFSIKNNFILHTDFLNILDFFKIILRLITGNFFYIKKDIIYKNLNLSDLINYEIVGKKFSHALLISLLNYYTFKKLKIDKADINIFIDWFENQLVDKSLNFSLSKFFPKTKLRGYFGINSDLDINNFLVPSKLEKKFNLAPKEIFIINKDQKRYFKKIYKNNLNLIPAFRNQNIFKYLKNKKKSNLYNYNVLVVFTGSYLDNLAMIKTINSLSKELCESINFLLRFHKNSETKKMVEMIDHKVKFRISGNENIYKLLLKSKCVISRPGTIFLEAKIFDVPIILTPRVYGVLPQKLNSSLKNSLCYENYEVGKKLKQLFKLRKKKNIIKKKLAEKSFTRYSYLKASNLIS